MAENHLRVVFLFVRPAGAHCWKQDIAANSRVAQCSKKWQSVLQGNTANRGVAIAILVVLARQGSGSALQLKYRHQYLDKSEKGTWL
ncbi:hypothetical protein LHU53_00500 [Rhodoferax sp. U2-2l]|uniref:hypothetical protein n=1 Tax=Rhodoferax sp. U2-2l TaxID=2884000 RepID=UPI001D09BFD2|nr:hypothetical protein [Rhodoferax sp. U2-2l]MCB8745385.1 hypothetical protein [Rhodoferax sp. U2-2l]